MSNPACANCNMRKKIESGCCVQGNHPEGTGSKTLILRKNSRVIRSIEACEHLDPQTGKCLIEATKPEECLSFNCGESYRNGW